MANLRKGVITCEQLGICGRVAKLVDTVYKSARSNGG
jgi:hypothetical protein